MAKAPAKASEMKTWSVVGQLRHDGVVYKPGDEVEMSERDAAPLVALDVLVHPDAGKGAKPAPVKPA